MFVSVSRMAALGCILLAYFGHVEAALPQPGTIRGGHRDTQPLYVATSWARSQDEKPLVQKPPGGSASEIEEIEAMCRAILANQPIERWRFETVRARYQALLKRSGQDPAVEDAIRVRLALVTQHEQAAEAARTIQTILAESHRRDREVTQVKRRIAASGRSRARAFSAMGFMQPSTQRVEGRQLYVLIARNGSTVAYLDIPPGLDADPMVAQRVGVRGVPHFNEDLGARLITVRDIETIEAKR